MCSYSWGSPKLLNSGKPFLNSGKSATSDAFWPLFGPFFTFLKKNQRIYILIFNFFSGWITILNINPGSIALGSPLIRIQRYKQNHLQFPEVRKLRKQATNAPKCFLNSGKSATSDAFWPLFGPFFTFLKKNQRMYILIFNQ